ncbi:MAG: TraR/DksA C4-type zinc finger protein [Patescibacteria group bacterium]
MDTKTLADFKYRLEKEKELLETELRGLGARNPSNPSDWVPAKPEGDEFGADRNDNADIIENMQDDNASMNELEGRLNTVIGALGRMDKGSYGVCEACGDPIQPERLKANPAASTCIAHMPPRQ